MSVRYYHDTQNSGFRAYGFNRKTKSLVRLADAGKRLLLGFEDEHSFDDIEYGCLDDDDIADEITDEVGSYVGTEHDGSVDYGFECVSQPMTLAAHVESDWIDRFCSICQSHDAQECSNGLHVHISRAGLGQSVATQDLAIAKMALWLERFENYFIRLARRNYTSSGWADRVEIADYADHSGDLVDAMRETGDDRYHSINITNSRTVEFRIFASTAIADRLKATLELVHALATFAMTNTLNTFRDGDWSAFCDHIAKGKYLYLKGYMLEMGVPFPESVQLAA